MSKINLH